jgi:hypothetical protein
MLKRTIFAHLLYQRLCHGKYLLSRGGGRARRRPNVKETGAGRTNRQNLRPAAEPQFISPARIASVSFAASERSGSRY